VPALSLADFFNSYVLRKTRKKNAAQGAPIPTYIFLLAVSALSAIMGDERLLASLDLMRRMPPSRMENSLEGAPIAEPPRVFFRASIWPRTALV
jgi:hypothetical protein